MRFQISGKAGLAVAVLLAVTLAGCNREMVVKHIGTGSGSHVSPPPVQIAKMPPGTFDQAREQSELAAAVSARASGDLAKARAGAESAVASWPGDAAAWKELQADCEGAKDPACALYAEFFGAKVEFVDTLPPRAAVLGFATLADSKVGTHSGNYTYDQRTLDTALRLASFYNDQDELAAVRPVPKPVAPKP